MIGLVYTEYDRPNDPRHLAGCLAFELLAAWHNHHVRAITDRTSTGVTRTTFWELCRDCDFIFYWGHGDIEGRDGSQLYGTSGRPIASVPALGTRLRDRDRIFYLDGCQVAHGLADDQFPRAQLVAPRRMVEYKPSVRMGATLMRHLFGRPRKTLKDAYTSLRRGRVAQAGSYVLMGGGRLDYVSVPAEVARDVVDVFDWVQRAWLSRA